MKRLTKKNLVILKRMYADYQWGDERKYNNAFEMFEDFITWKLDSEQRSNDVCQMWLGFLRSEQVNELTCPQPWSVIDDFCRRQNSRSYDGFLTFTGE